MSGDQKWDEATINLIIAGDFLPVVDSEEELAKMNAAIDGVKGSTVTDKLMAKQTLEIEFMSKH